MLALNFRINAQDASLNSFIKKEGFVKFTDITHLPLLVKHYYREIERCFNSSHFDKNIIYIKSTSIKPNNGFVDIQFMGIDGLVKLRKQEEQNLPAGQGALGKNDGILIVNLKSGSIMLEMDQ